MIKWCRNLGIVVLAISILGAGMIPGSSAQADPLKDRKAAMKKMNNANKAIKKAAQAGDMAAVTREARVIVAVTRQIEALFPKGTGRAELGQKATRAKDVIWQDWATFQTRIKALRSAASNIANGDMKAAMKGVGKSCGACHKLFRGSRPKKN
jgi:cytochrome c556